MKEEQLLTAFIVADLVARTLCTDLSPEESLYLQEWTRESPENQQVLNDLSDVEMLNQQIMDFNKYNKAECLAKIRKRRPDA